MDNLQFFTMQIPGNILEEHYVICACLIQGVRLAGMLHDLGHPPYSHTLESIIQLLYSEITAKDPKKINNLENKFIELSEKYIKNVNKKSQALHEALSREMFEVVEEEIARTFEDWDRKKEDLEVFPLISIFSFRIAYKLLYEDSFIYKSLHCLISGLVDVDRLDYTSRDLFCSAVTKDIINYDRLFLHYALHKDGKKFIVTPEVKSIQDIEAFLRKRWLVYRDIDYHHNVHKSGLLMQKLLIKDTHKTFREEKRSFEEIKKDNIEKLPENFILGIMIILNHMETNLDNQSLQKNY